MKLILVKKDDIPSVIHLAEELNPKIKKETLYHRLEEAFSYTNYQLFALVLENKIIGLCSAWLSTRLYSGKQLELDNFVIQKKYRSKSYGEKFNKLIEKWAKQEGCLRIELNSYVINGKSHKFYFNQGFEILGYHFYKIL